MSDPNVPDPAQSDVAGFGPHGWTIEEALQAAYDWGRGDAEDLAAGRPLVTEWQGQQLTLGGVSLAVLRERFAGRRGKREATESEVAEMTGLDVHTAATSDGGHTMHAGAREACPQCTRGGDR